MSDCMTSIARVRCRPIASLLVTLAITYSCAYSMAMAADWKPAAQVEIVVPNSPGGGNDAVARLMQKIVQDRRLVPTPVVVVNKPAGGGSATLSYLGQKLNDPHTLAVVSITQQLSYIGGTTAQGYRDFTPLATMIGDFIGFAVRADSPITSGKDLIERLKKDPAALTTGVTALGGNNHIALVMAARSAGVDTRKLKTPVFQSSGRLGDRAARRSYRCARRQRRSARETTRSRPYKNSCSHVRAASGRGARCDSDVEGAGHRGNIQYMARHVGAQGLKRRSDRLLGRCARKTFARSAVERKSRGQPVGKRLPQQPRHAALSRWAARRIARCSSKSSDSRRSSIDVQLGSNTVSNRRRSARSC